MPSRDGIPRLTQSACRSTASKLIAAVTTHKAGLGRHTPPAIQGKRARRSHRPSRGRSLLLTICRLLRSKTHTANGRLRGRQAAPAPRSPRTCSYWAVPWLRRHQTLLCSSRLSAAVRTARTSSTAKVATKSTMSMSHQALEIVERRRLLLRVVLCESRSISRKCAKNSSLIEMHVGVHRSRLRARGQSRREARRR